MAGNVESLYVTNSGVKNASVDNGGLKVGKVTYRAFTPHGGCEYTGNECLPRTPVDGICQDRCVRVNDSHPL